MVSIKDLVKEIAEDNKWSYQEANGLIKIDAEGKRGNWQTFCKCIEEEGRFCYYSLCPGVTPKENIPYMSEVITRINYGMKIGNLEMDCDTGEIHFKTYVDFFDANIQKEAIAQCMYINIIIFNEYYENIMRAIYSTVRDEEFLKSL